MSHAGAGDQICSRKNLLIIGPIVHSTKIEEIDIIDDHLILIQNGKVTCVVPATELNDIREEHGIRDCEVLRLQPGEFLMPGLVDTHIHAPQYPNIGLGYDKTLLDWLTTYTFPLEKQYSDIEFAKQVYEAVVKHSISCGTTTACYFATIHLTSSIELAHIVGNIGQRAFIGKVNMNFDTPVGYGETTEDSIRDTETFIQKIQEIQNETILPIITPRFALSCDMDLMKELGKLAQKYDVHIQTHISENVGEVAAVKALYPSCKNYADVYDKANLLTHKTILAHGVYLEDEELKVLADRQSSVSHCPNSNTSLRSGLCKVRRLLSSGVKVGLGTDVSGGYSPSILNAMQNALSVGIHLSFQDDEIQPLNYNEVFYLATVGGAEALVLDHKIGNFMDEKDFDALVIDMRQPNTPNNSLLDNKTVNLVQKFIYTGDDRNIVKVFVAGKQIK